MTTAQTFASKIQLRNALDAAGITGYLITGAGRSLEVEVKNDKDQRAFSKKVARWGGFRTGYGAWVLRPNYTAANPND